jgi:hypothetical protein
MEMLLVVDSIFASIEYGVVILESILFTLSVSSKVTPQIKVKSARIEYFYPTLFSR